MPNKKRGLTLAITGCILWGISGTVAEYDLTAQHLTPMWLVGVRLLFAGTLLIIWYAASHGKQVFDVWRRPKTALLLITFAFLGMVPSQLTYYMAINYGNAPTATVLQFLGIIFIIAYMAFATRRLPRRIDVFSVILAVIGTFFLVTNGHLDRLALSPLALSWGVLAGVAQATYTLIPQKLLEQFDARLVVGWSMVVGSLPFMWLLVHTPMPKFTVSGVASIAFIVIFGTMIAYLFYLKSLTDILPSTTGMLSSFEPLTATLLSVTLLHTEFSSIQLFGGLLIMSTTFLQALPARKLSPLQAAAAEFE